jgi:hypothetical protein
MAIVKGPQIFRTDQQCDKCTGAILMRPQWEDGSNWGARESPMPNEKWCENGCSPAESGGYKKPKA